MTGITMDHSTVGDRTLITVTFPPEAMTVSGPDGVSVTLDDDDWQGTAKRVLAEYNAAERGMDSAAVALRVEQALSDAVTRAVNGGCEPETARRRAVAGTLHRIADMVVGGTIREVVVEWPAWTEHAPGDEPDPAQRIFVSYSTRRVTREVSLSLKIPDRGPR